MCCWPFVDVVLEDPPKKEEDKKYALVSDQLNLVGLWVIMSFYYDYTGPYPGSLRRNQANQTPAEPLNPWLVPKKDPTPVPPSYSASNHYTYYPQYDPPKPAAPVNPWLVPKPEEPKPSAPSKWFLPIQPAPTYQPHAQLYYSGQPLPEPTKIWYGSTKAQVDAQNAAIAHSAGAYQPMQLTPANPTAAQQFWCLEPNHRDYTLRTMTDIETSCQPGAWHTAATGYPYFIRNKA
ncbi:MAG: hypothetical protein Q9220_003916 [cf. Caloplaca sp. 1 TL-2023]